MLTREQVLSADDLRSIDVDVPEWGGTLRVRTMTGKERQVFQTEIKEAQGKMPAGFMERLIVACAVDDKGKPLFTADDIAALGGKSALALERVFEVAAELNGMTNKSVDDIKGE